jgi:hypothetical protein
VVEPLGFELPVPDHKTVSQRAARLESITCAPLRRTPLLEQIESPNEQVTADGACDGEPSDQTIAPLGQLGWRGGFQSHA